jgi:hypothetical protein
MRRLEALVSVEDLLVVGRSEESRRRTVGTKRKAHRPSLLRASYCKTDVQRDVGRMEVQGQWLGKYGREATIK